MQSNENIFGAIFLIIIIIMIRMSSGKPVKPRFFTRHSGNRVLEWDGLGVDAKAQQKARLRSPRLFKSSPDDNSEIWYDEMTEQEKWDAGFRKKG